MKLSPAARKEIATMRAEVLAILRDHPNRADISGRGRNALHSLIEIAGGDHSPEIFGALRGTLTELRALADAYTSQTRSA